MFKKGDKVQSKSGVAYDVVSEPYSLKGQQVVQVRKANGKGPVNAVRVANLTQVKEA